MSFYREGDYYTVGAGGQFLGTNPGNLLTSVATDGWWTEVVTISVDFNGTPTTGSSPLTVNFEDATTIPTGYYIESHVWDFGDGTILSGYYPTVSHNYESAGRFSVTLGMRVCEV